MHRRIAAGIAALTLAVGLSACAASGQSYADLERDQTDQDRLPVSTPGGGSDDPLAIDADSTRLVAVQGDTEIFLASATEQGQPRICIIVFAATEPFRTCGDGDQVTLSDSVNRYTVLSDAVVDTQLDPDEGWTKISENVFTRPVEPTTSDTQ